MSDDTPNTPAPQWKLIPPFQDVHDALRPNVQKGTAYGERVPKLPFQYFLDPSGNKVRVALGTTRNYRGAVEAGGDPRRNEMANRNRVLRQGFIPWEYMDAKAYAPHLVNFMDKGQWEVWIEEELKRRRSEHNRKSEERDAQWQANERAKTEAMADSIKEVMDRKFADYPTKKRKDTE